MKKTSIKQMMKEIDILKPKNTIDYILNGSGLNQYLEKHKIDIFGQIDNQRESEREDFEKMLNGLSVEIWSGNDLNILWSWIEKHTQEAVRDERERMKSAMEGLASIYSHWWVGDDKERVCENCKEVVTKYTSCMAGNYINEGKIIQHFINSLTPEVK